MGQFSGLKTMFPWEEEQDYFPDEWDEAEAKAAAWQERHFQQPPVEQGTPNREKISEAALNLWNRKIDFVWPNWRICFSSLSLKF